MQRPPSRWLWWGDPPYALTHADLTLSARFWAVISE